MQPDLSVIYAGGMVRLTWSQVEDIIAGEGRDPREPATGRFRDVTKMYDTERMFVDLASDQPDGGQSS